MRHDTEETAQDQLGDAVRPVSVEDLFEPLPEGGVLGSVFPVSVHQDVDITQDHRRAP
jgi:hypothetical protein